MTELSGGNIEQEIAALEKQLQEKKAELGQAAEAGKEAPPDKEILRQVVGQNIQQAAQTQAQPQPTMPVLPPSADTPSYADPELQPKVQELVNTAFSKSIQDAIRSAVATNNPALIDAFHDVLVDQLYGELIARKKVEQP